MRGANQSNPALSFIIEHIGAVRTFSCTFIGAQIFATYSALQILNVCKLRLLYIITVVVFVVFDSGTVCRGDIPQWGLSFMLKFFALHFLNMAAS